MTDKIKDSYLCELWAYPSIWVLLCLMITIYSKEKLHEQCKAHWLCEFTSVIVLVNTFKSKHIHMVARSLYENV